MPRRARIYGNSNFYHVINRGIDRHILFEEPADYQYFLKILERFSRELSVTVVAYCLMSNHVHLLLNSKPETLSLFMKKLQISYAYFFNAKYERQGHLFQDRFQSEPIEDERYLLTVLRYVLNNPVKAGIAFPEEYPWSSFWLYDGESFVDTSIFRAYLGDFKHYHEFILKEEQERETDAESDTFNAKTDEDAIITAKEILGDDYRQLSHYSKKERDDAILKLYRAGIPVRQIARITGTGRGVVRGICKRRQGNR